MDLKNMIPGVAQAELALQALSHARGRGIAAVMLAASCSTAVGGISYVHEAVDKVSHADKTVTRVALGKAAIIQLDYNTDQEVFVGYKARVGGSTAKITHTIFGINYGNTASETFTGDVKADICQKASVTHMTYDPNTNKAILDEPKNALSVCVNTDITTREFTPHNGITKAYYKIWDDIFRGLQDQGATIPGFQGSVDGENSTDNKLRNFAELQADAQVARECGPKAWPLLAKAYEADVQQKALKYFHLFKPESPVPTISVQIDGAPVEATTALDFSTQYEPIIQKIKHSKTHVDLTAAKNGVGQCNVAPASLAVSTPGAGSN